MLLVIYIGIYFYIRKNPKAEAHGVVPYGPLIMIRTKWGLKMMDRLAVHRRFWRFMGSVSMVISFILMAGIVLILAIDVLALPAAMRADGIGIEYALAIPGLNPMLPLVYGIIGLVIAMVIHELSHGIQSRANDVPVESSGILYGVVPLGAFVEPSQDGIQRASRRAKMDIYAAGITTNFIASLVLFTVLFFSMTGGLVCDHSESPAVYGIANDSPASGADIPVSSIIVSIGDGTEVVEIDTVPELMDYINSHASTEFTRYDVCFLHDGEYLERNLPMGACVSFVDSRSPAMALPGLSSGSMIVAMGTDPASMVPVAFPADIGTIASQYAPGELVYVKYTDPDYNVHTAAVHLGDKDGHGYLGVGTSFSGFQLVTPDMVLNQGINPFYGADSITDVATGMFRFIGAPFNGFSPVPENVTWWFDCTVMNDGVFWILMFIIYWTMWLNLVLGISNALPCHPFDGGPLFLGGIDWLMEKFGVEASRREGYVNIISNLSTVTVMMVMGLVLIAIIF